MAFLFGLFIVIYVFVCIILIFLVLIQSDKGGGISGAIGGGLSGANALLGTQDTANILTKGTTWFAGTYMALCIVISVFLSHGVSNTAEKSLLKKRAESQEQSFSPASALQGQTGVVPANVFEGQGQPASTEGGAVPAGSPAPLEVPAPAPAPAAK